MDTKYTGHLGIRFTPAWRAWTEQQRREAAAEVVDLFGEFDATVTLRGAYLTQGFRVDTDLFLWMIADEADAIQELQLCLQRASIGAVTEVSWAFCGVAMESEFNKAHLPAFLKGVAAKRFVCFYPYSRSATWYVLPPDERAALLREHVQSGREFPDVLTNGVYGFGLGDYEWLLSFETDDLATLSALVRK